MYWSTQTMSLDVFVDAKGWPDTPLANLRVITCLFIRKKKKDKESKHRLEQVVTSQNDEEVKTKKAYIDKRTPAQIAFDKMQEKRVSYCSPALNSCKDWLRI